MRDDTPYNPLDKLHLGESVAEALLRRPICLLSDISPFQGAGIYAIYFVGDFPAYRIIAEANREGKFALPIYVGRAVPKGGRKGAYGLDSPSGQALFNRLKKHAASINDVDNLSIKHFYCRYLLVDDIWIPLGESLLIAMFAPLWNNRVDGFGNHDPGKGRYEGMRPRWDVLHPGRAWATKCAERPESAKQIITEIETYLEGVILPVNLDSNPRQT